MRSLFRIARDRADLVALGLLLVAIPVLLRNVPGGIYGLGLVGGAGLAMQAVGLVLVYRSNRIINFAQVQIGVLAAVLFRLLVEQRTLLTLLRAACEPCLPRETPTVLAVTYWLSLLLCLGLAALLAFLVYRFVVRRFADAPRMVLSLATIGVAQFLAFVQSTLPRLLATSEQERLSQVPQGVAAPPPLDLELRWEPAIFRAPDLLLLAVGVLAIVGLLVSLRRSRSGIAIRAAAENRDRAATLGIDVDRVTQRVWVTAGLLSGAAAIVAAMSAPAAPPASLDITTTVRILAAAVIAAMTSVPIAALAALALGIVDQAMLWVFRSTAPVDGLMTALIGGVLLLQRARASRVEHELASSWRAAREIRPIPAELRNLPTVRRVLRFGAFGGAALIMALPFLLSPSQVNVTTGTLLYAIVGLSLLVLSGWAGQLSLGQFAFAAVGGYAAALARGNLHLPLPLCLALAMLAGAVAAILVGAPGLKLRGLHLAITTLAVSLTTTALLLNPSQLGRHLPESIDRGSLLGLSLAGHRAFYVVTLTILVLVVFAVVGLRRSKIGRALIAARDNEQAARSFGIAPVRARLGAFALSGAIAALAGGLLVFQQLGLQPASFTPDVSIAMFLMVVIGGLGGIAGPLLGATFFGILRLLSASPAIVFLATGGGVVLLLLLAPGGLVQLAADARDAWLRRIAERHRVLVPSLLADARPGSGDARAPLLPKPGAFVPRRYRLEEPS